MVSGKTKAMSKISLKNLLVTVKGEFHMYKQIYKVEQFFTTSGFKYNNFDS